MFIRAAHPAIIPQQRFCIGPQRDRVTILGQSAPAHTALRLKHQLFSGIGTAPAERHLAAMYRDFEVPAFDLTQGFRDPAGGFLDLARGKCLTAQLQVSAHLDPQGKWPGQLVPFEAEYLGESVGSVHCGFVPFGLQIRCGGVETPQTRCVVLNPRATGDIRPDIGLCGSGQHGRRQPQRRKKGHFVDVAGYRARRKFRV